MGEPLYKTQRNKRTGEVRDLISNDDGATWQLDEGVAASPEQVAADKAAYLADRTPEQATSDAAAGVSDSAAPPTPPPTPPAASKLQQEIPWHEALLRGARDTAGMGFADEAAGMGAKLAGDDVKRTAGRGMDAPVDPKATAYTAERDAQRADDARALRESPTLYRTGEAVGFGGTIAAPFGKLGAAAPAALGAVNAAGASEAGTAGGVARDAAVGGATGYVGGKLIGKAVEKAAPLVSRKLGEWSGKSMDAANKRYLRASGVSGHVIDNIEDKGDIARYAEGGRRLGIGKGFLPQTVDKFADDAQAVAMRTKGERAALEEALRENGGAPVDPDRLARSIKGIKRDYAKGGDVGQPLRDQVDEIASNMRRMRQSPIKTTVENEGLVPDETISTSIEPKTTLQRGARGKFERTPEIPLDIDVERFANDIPVEIPRSIPWSRANKERIQYGASTNFTPGTPRAAIKPKVYGKLNDALVEAADEAMPGVGTKWRQAGEDQHVALTLGEHARGRENAEFGNRAISPTDYGAGFSVGMATGDPTAGVASGFANRLFRGREQSLLERVNRNQSGLQDAVSRGAAKFGQNTAPATQVGARAVGQQAEPIGRAMPAFGSAAYADDGNKSRGQMLPDAAMRLYKQQPAAFGRWQRDIFEARQQGEGQLAAVITRLQGDPEFARTVLPKLQAMTRSQTNREKSP